jgi:hypothetical protein
MESRGSNVVFLSSELLPDFSEEIIVENALAEAMLSEICKDEKIKEVLASIAILVNEKIYNSICQAISEVNFNINSIKKNISTHNGCQFEKAIRYLITEHTNVGRQKTGIFKDLTPDQITSDLLKELFINLSKNLLIGNNINNQTDVEKCIKSLTDACFCYVEYFSHKNNENFEEVKSLIMPSDKESLARIKYAENGQSEKLTISSSSGIGKDGNALVDKKDAPLSAYASGKSTYTKVASLRRLEIEVNKFDQIELMLEELLTQRNDFGLDDKEEERLRQVNEAYEVSSNILKEFKVPLKAKDRNSLDTYSRKSLIENLADSSVLPLIATSSGTEGRALITLYDLGAFGKDNEFDPNKALLITNCIFSVLQYGGHHSYVELVEPYNRLLDAVGIACVNKNKPANFESFQIPIVAAGNKEQITKFIHEKIRANVVASMEKLINPALGSESQETKTDVHPKIHRSATSSNAASIFSALSLNSGINVSQTIEASRAVPAISSTPAPHHSKQEKKSEELIAGHVEANIDSSITDIQKDKASEEVKPVSESAELPRAPSPRIK